MTFCKKLAEAQRGPDTVTAWEEIDKYSACPRYTITESRNGIAHTVTNTAKTTWKRKFKEIVGG